MILISCLYWVAVASLSCFIQFEFYPLFLQQYSIAFGDFQNEILYSSDDDLGGDTIVDDMLGADHVEPLVCQFVCVLDRL